MGFVVRVWCPDCCGEDFQGCYDGGSELVADHDSGKPTVFSTIEEARAAGKEQTADSIYNYQIERYGEPLRGMLIPLSEPAAPPVPEKQILTSDKGE